VKAAVNGKLGVPVLAGAVALAVCAALLIGLGQNGSKPRQTLGAPAAAAAPSGALPRSHPQVVEPSVGQPVVIENPAAAEPTVATPAGHNPDPEAKLAALPAGATPSPGAPTDAQVRAELRSLQHGSAGQAQVLPDGTAQAPFNAPDVIKRMIAAGNAIARTPYIWGGGHARLFDRGYDCSGSLSFAMINAGLLDHTLASGWANVGVPGPGRWLSIYRNSGHVWAMIAGLRFDTSALHIAGSRWTTEQRSLAGFSVRHLPGL